ncbi:MAG: queuosine salvage family protein [Candidatus Acidiferrales bacterium]
MMLAAAGGEGLRRAAASSSFSTSASAESAPVRWPKPIGSPVLDSLRPVIEHSRDVRTDVDNIVEVASWMAYEELPMPDYAEPLDIGSDPNKQIDFIMVTDAIDTAFTDFSNHVKFQVDYMGQHWSDSEAEFACLRRAMDNGTPILDGRYLAKITRDELNKIFAGNIEMPMLDEKLAVLHEVGGVLAAKYDGRFSNFIHSCSPKLYDNGNGMIDRLVKEFPRFNDVSMYDGHEIRFYKLAQLGVWMLYRQIRKEGFRLEDPEKMTAFADYIVPAALRILGILKYSPALEHTINTYQLIPRDSTQEIEIRAHLLYATALLREEVNKIRPPELQVIIPQIDARLWLPYHTTFWPHHLTRTIMY